VSVQADLALAASLGLEHAERNGHHFHPGLSYLEMNDQLNAMREHPDFYSMTNGVVAPTLRDGKFQIGSLLRTGFGFASAPDERSFLSLDEWDVEKWERIA
jgi:hypothetical protein